MGIEILDCLKRKRDICIKTIIEVLHGSHVAWQEQKILFPMGKEVFFLCQTFSLFLPYNMATVQNLYTQPKYGFHVDPRLYSVQIAYRQIKSKFFLDTCTRSNIGRPATEVKDHHEGHESLSQTIGSSLALVTYIHTLFVLKGLFGIKVH